MSIRSDHAAGHEAADRNPERRPDGPYHRASGAIGLGNDGVVGHLDPLALKPYAVVPLVRFPIGIGNDDTIGVRAARAEMAPQAVKPRLEGRVLITSVIATQSVLGAKHKRHNQQ